MKPEIQAVIKMLDFHIYITELNDIIEKKNIAVRNQNFDQAALLKNKENELRNLLPKIEEFKELKEELSKLL
jgi:hypothetical protein